MNPIPSIARIFWAVYFAGILVTFAVGGPELALLWWAAFPLMAILSVGAVLTVARFLVEWDSDLEEHGPDRYVPTDLGIRAARPALRLLARRR